MSRSTVNKYRKIDEILIKIAVSFFLILIMTQWYLRLENRGIDPFLNKLYNEDGLRFEMIDIIPMQNSN